MIWFVWFIGLFRLDGLDRFDGLDRLDSSLGFWRTSLSPLLQCLRNDPFRIRRLRRELSRTAGNTYPFQPLKDTPLLQQIALKENVILEEFRDGIEPQPDAEKGRP